jgi:hypothetical protein
MAISAPIPWLAPVTTATNPFNERILISQNHYFLFAQQMRKVILIRLIYAKRWKNKEGEVIFFEILIMGRLVGN